MENGDRCPIEQRELMPDGKVMEFARGSAAVDSSATNVIAHTFSHLVQKRCQFFG
jgi:hypothetical protein